jgi:hypothetical protein
LSPEPFSYLPKNAIQLKKSQEENLQQINLGIEEFRDLGIKNG